MGARLVQRDCVIEDKIVGGGGQNCGARYIQKGRGGLPRADRGAQGTVTGLNRYRGGDQSAHRNALGAAREIGRLRNGRKRGADGGKLGRRGGLQIEAAARADSRVACRGNRNGDGRCFDRLGRGGAAVRGDVQRDDGLRERALVGCDGGGGVDRGALRSYRAGNVVDGLRNGRVAAFLGDIKNNITCQSAEALSRAVGIGADRHSVLIGNRERIRVE